MQVKNKIEHKESKKCLMIENEVITELRGASMNEIDNAIHELKGTEIKDNWLKQKIEEIKEARIKRHAKKESE